MPEFTTDFNGLMITFKYPTVEKEVGEKVGENLTENQRQILSEISSNPYISAKQLAVLVGISQRKIEGNIQKLRAKGLLERIGGAKGGYWEVKQ